MSTPEEIKLHTRLMTEHCLFLYLGIEDTTLRNQAKELYTLWFNYYQNGQGDLRHLLTTLRVFKEIVLLKLTQGQWLGWLSASFVDHLLDELLYFERKLNGEKLSLAEEAATAMKAVHHHAASAESWIDPSEEEWRDVMRAIKDKNKNVPKNDAQFLIGLSIQNVKELDEHLHNLQINLSKVKTSLHPLLVDHWIREGHDLLNILSGQK